MIRVGFRELLFDTSIPEILKRDCVWMVTGKCGSEAVAMMVSCGKRVGGNGSCQGNAFYIVVGREGFVAWRWMLM